MQFLFQRIQQAAVIHALDLLRNIAAEIVSAEGLASSVQFLVAVITPARLCSQTFFGFDCAVEFLFTFLEGESHGRFISVIGE